MSPAHVSLAHTSVPHTSLAVVGAVLDGEPVGVRVIDGRIAAIGAGVGAEPGDDVLDGTDCALVPGLVNGHTHAAMTLFRGYGSDLPLIEWLETRVWPKEAVLTDDDVYWGTRLACLEMIRSGTVRFWDMYWHPGAVARAVDDAGLRATVGLPLIDGLDASRGRELRADALRSLDELAEVGARVQASFTPHGIYTVSEDSLRWIAEEAEAHALPIHLHFLEIEDEITGLRERTGEEPAAYLDRLGLLTPRTLLAHAVWMGDRALDLVSERGSTVVTNPVSNMKLAVGRVFPYAAVHARGIPVGMGTDGAATNNSLDLLADVKVLALLQKYDRDDPAVMPADEAWAVATGARAPMLGQSGRIAVGEAADFLLVRLDAPEMNPGHLVPNLVYAATGSVVDATVVDGRVLMRGRHVDDEREIRAKVNEVAARLGVLEE
jgi:5-methylthioadenosine/S-adenosylhomocysteine deaminase